MTLIQLDGPTGNRYYTVSITDITPSSLPGDQSEWEYWPGYDVTLRCEWETTGAPAFAQATSIAIRMVDPNGSTSPIGSTWNCQPGGSGSGVQTRTLHFDTNPLDESLGTNASGMIEMYICASVGGLGGWSAESRSTSPCAGGLSNPVTNNWARGYIRSNIIITGSDTSKISFGGFEPDIFTLGDPTYNTVLHAIPYETFDRNISHIQYGTVLRTGESEGSDPVDANTNVSFNGSQSINTDYNLDEVDVNLNITNVTFDRDSKYVFNSTGHADGWTINSPLSATYSDRFMVSAATNINDPIRLECPSDNFVDEQIFCDVNLYFLNGSSRTGATVNWFIFNGSSESSSFSGTASEFSSDGGTYWLNFTPTDIGVYRVLVNTSSDVGAGSDIFRASTRVRVRESFLTQLENSTLFNTNSRVQEINTTTQDTNSIVSSIQSVLNSLDTFLRNAWGDDSAETIKNNITDNTTAETGSAQSNLTTEINNVTNEVWDEPLTGATHNEPTSAGRILREVGSSTFVIRENTAQGGTDNTITLDAGASSVNNIYDPSRVTIIDGTGAGQSRLVIEYNGTTKVAVVDKDWRINPDATSKFILNSDIGGMSVNEGRFQSATSTTATLNVDASSTDNIYEGDTIFIFSGTGQDQSRIIRAYNGTTRVATVHKAWDVTPDNTSGYEILPIGQTETVYFGDDAETNISFISENVTAEHNITRTNFTIQFDSINVTEGDIDALQNNLTEEHQITRTNATQGLETVNTTVKAVGSNLTNANTTIHSHIDETESDILDNTTSEINSAVTSIIAEVDAVASEVWTFTTRTVTSISQSIITRS